MELYRVFTNRKLITLFCVVLLLNLLLSYALENQNWRNDGGSSLYQVKEVAAKIDLTDQSDHSVSETCVTLQNILLLSSYETMRTEDEDAAVVEQEIQALRESDPDIARWYDSHSDVLDLDAVRTRLYIYSQELEKRTYLNGYSAYLQDTIDKAESSAGISVFKNGFSQSAFEMLKSDYAHLNSADLRQTNTIAYEKSVSNTITSILLVVFVCACCIILFYNKELNVDLVIRSCKNGRVQLYLNRFFSVCLLLVFTIILLYVENFLLYGWFYGYDIDWNASVQSASYFESYLYVLTFWQYLLVFIATNTAVFLVVFLAVYFIMNFSGEIGTTFLLITIVTGGEYLLYISIPVYSPFSLFRGANIFSFINNDVWVQYGNYNLFSNAVRVTDLLYWSLAVVLIILFTSNMFFTAKVHTIRTKSKVQLLIAHFTKKLGYVAAFLQEKCFSCGYETYKLFVSQKFAIVLLVAVILFSGTYSFGGVELSPIDAYLKQFYTQYGGELTERAREEVATLRATDDVSNQKIEQAKIDFQNGTLSASDYLDVVNRSFLNSTQTQAVRQLEEQITYIDSQQALGRDAYLMNTVAYDNLIGREAANSASTHIVLFLFVLLFLAYGLFSADKNKKLVCLLHSTPNGRNMLLRNKVLLVSELTFILYMAWTVFDLIYIGYYFGYDYPNAPVQSLEVFANFPFNISLTVFIILYFIFRFILLLAVMYLLVCLNAAFENRLSLLVGFALFLSPSLLGFLNLDLISNFSISNLLNFAVAYSANPNYPYIFPFLCVGVFLVAVFALVWLFRINKKRRKKYVAAN